MSAPIPMARSLTRMAPVLRTYAVSNVSAHLEYGIGYQAGYSLTSGMTFGYLAVQHMLHGG